MAAFLNYEAAPQRDEETDDTVDDAPLSPATWLSGGSPIVASAELASATTLEESIAAAERLFFGKVNDVEQLRRQDI